MGIGGPISPPCVSGKHSHAPTRTRRRTHPDLLCSHPTPKYTRLVRFCTHLGHSIHNDHLWSIPFWNHSLFFSLGAVNHDFAGVGSPAGLRIWLNCNTVVITIQVQLQHSYSRSLNLTTFIPALVKRYSCVMGSISIRQAYVIMESNRTPRTSPLDVSQGRRFY